MLVKCVSSSRIIKSSWIRRERWGRL